MCFLDIQVQISLYTPVYFMSDTITLILHIAKLDYRVLRRPKNCFNYLRLEDPEPLNYFCLSVRLSHLRTAD